MTKPGNPWPAVDPGKLRHSIQIQKQSSTQDAFGQPIATWATIRTCYASIDAATPKELFSAGQLTSEVTHVIVVRWTATQIQPGMQIVFGSRTYKVQAVDNVSMRNVYDRLLCLELNAGS